MGFLSIFRRAAPQPTARVEPAVVASSASFQSERQWSNGFVGPTLVRAGVRVDESSVIGLPAVLQALRVMAGVYAMAPQIYFRRSERGRERATDEPLYRLLHDAPNSHQSAYAFRELQMGDVLLHGEWNAYISRDANQTPIALTRLKPGHCVPVMFFDPAEGETLFYDATLPDGTNRRFASRDILRIVGLSRDGYTGLSLLRVAREALGGAIATDRHAQRFWASGGRVHTVLQAKGKIPPSDKTAMRSDWSAIYANPDVDGVAVLDQDVTAQFLGHDNQKQQFIESRTFNINDLSRLLGIPPHLLFELTRSTNNNIEHQSLEFVLYHMGPHFTRADAAMTRQLAAPGHYFETLVDALVRGDLRSRMEALWYQRQMGMINGNEARELENRSRLPGDAGEAYWRPSNMELTGTTSPDPQPQGHDR